MKNKFLLFTVVILLSVFAASCGESGSKNENSSKEMEISDDSKKVPKDRNFSIKGYDVESYNWELVSDEKLKEYSTLINPKQEFEKQYKKMVTINDYKNIKCEEYQKIAQKLNLKLIWFKEVQYSPSGEYLIFYSNRDYIYINRDSKDKNLAQKMLFDIFLKEVKTGKETKVVSGVKLKPDFEEIWWLDDVRFLYKDNKDKTSVMPVYKICGIDGVVKYLTISNKISKLQKQQNGVMIGVSQSRNNIYVCKVNEYDEIEILNEMDLQDPVCSCIISKDLKKIFLHYSFQAEHSRIYGMLDLDAKKVTKIKVPELKQSQKTVRGNFYWCENELIFKPFTYDDNNVLFKYKF